MVIFNSFNIRYAEARVGVGILKVITISGLPEMPEAEGDRVS